MSIFGRLKGFVAARSLGGKFAALLQAHDNQSQMLHAKLSELVQALDNLSELLNQKLSTVVQAVDSQSNSLGERLSALSQGLDNQSNLLNEKFSVLSQGIDNQTELLNRKLDDIRFKSATAVELQQAGLVMQRDVADAVHELTRSINGVKSAQPPAADRTRAIGRTPLA